MERELIQARRDRIVSSGKNDYQPSQRTTEPNRARFNNVGPRWATQS
jgi:hypothetical protein